MSHSCLSGCSKTICPAVDAGNKFLCLSYAYNMSYSYFINQVFVAGLLYYSVMGKCIFRI